jgi:hypothetical protein
MPHFSSPTGNQKSQQLIEQQGKTGKGKTGI